MIASTVQSLLVVTLIYWPDLGADLEAGIMKRCVFDVQPGFIVAPRRARRTGPRASLPRRHY
jgi:hypothetical protein